MEAPKEFKTSFMGVAREFQGSSRVLHKSFKEVPG